MNKRIDWQRQNAQRGLSYIQIDLRTAKLYVFVDGSFANNKNLNSQIGYVIFYGNECSVEQVTGFQVTGNIIYWLSTKCYKITKNVLASEIYSIISGFNIGFVLKTIIATILEKLDLPPLPMVICTDSLSLYQYLAQLGIIAKKRFIINLLNLKQSYKDRETEKIRWISGETNPADSITKKTPNQALTELINTNSTLVRIKGLVKRLRNLQEEAKKLKDELN